MVSKCVPANCLLITEREMVRSGGTELTANTSSSELVTRDGQMYHVSHLMRGAEEVTPNCYAGPESNWKISGKPHLLFLFVFPQQLKSKVTSTLQKYQRMRRYSRVKVWPPHAICDCALRRKGDQNMSPRQTEGHPIWTWSSSVNLPEFDTYTAAV